MKKLRHYQVDIANRASKIIKKHGVCYLAMEVRTGKTLTALNTAEVLGKKNVLFVTKKRAMQSIEGDYNDFGFTFDMIVVNYESLHKVQGKFDLIICDEFHSCGAFPKPSNRTKMLRNMTKGVDVLALSGTPSPESFSQIYHQFWCTNKGPFTAFNKFYDWARVYVDVKQKRIGSHIHNDYSHGKQEMIVSAVKPYMITFTQLDAGFSTIIDEEVVHIDMKKTTYNLAKKLLKDRVVEKDDKLILADTPAKLQQKLHQIYSGTIILEDGEPMTIDDSKLRYIEERFKDEKIGIFYQYKQELVAIKEYFGDKITEDVNEFNTTDKNIALQFVSGREGINLSKAKYLVNYNISFSATTYWQARDRMSTIDRKSNDVVWLFSKNGLEDKVYDAVKGKRKYTTELFKKDLFSL